MIEFTDSPPPNTPPRFEKCPEGGQYYAEEGKTTAKVLWPIPEATDQEDGHLRLK